MRIGIARRGYSPTGGAEAYLSRLLRGLRDAGHATVLFGAPEWPEARLYGAALVALDARQPGPFDRQLQAARRAHPCDVLLSLERVSDCEVFRAGDGVHRAWLERRRVIEPPYKRFFRWTNPKHRATVDLEDRMLSSPNLRRVIANSAMVKQELIQWHGLPEDRITVIPNGLPQDAFGFDAALRERKRLELGLQEGQPVALFAGSGWERKGLRWATEAVRRVTASSEPELVLLVAGKGRPPRHPHPAIRYLGPRQDVRDLMMAADLFILPTLYDPFSNATLEALATGLPVITSQANGCSEITENGKTGETVRDPTDLDALSRALQAWCRARFSIPRDDIIDRVRPYTLEANVQRTIEALTD